MKNKQIIDLNSDLEFFDIICIDNENDSQIHAENGVSPRDNSNTKLFGQTSSTKITPTLESSSKKQIMNRRISTDFNDSFNINAEDFEKDIFKSLLESNATNKTIKRNRNSESPNLFSASSSESLLKRFEAHNSDNFNTFVSPVIGKGNRKLSPQFIQTSCGSQYSQLLKSSQVQKQLDEVICREQETRSKRTPSPNVLQVNNKINSFANIQQADIKISKLPISSTSGKRKSSESSFSNAKVQKTDEQSLNDTQNKENESPFNYSKYETGNLKNNDIEFNSSQYRKGITQLFERMERSICQFGPNHNDKESDIQASKNIIGTDWPDDSFMANLSLEGFIEQAENGSINDVIKRALKGNVGKAIRPRNLVNRTFVNAGVTFRELGTFYGLPDKVMELIKLYKGIDKLYGRYLVSIC